jgi:2',3'-cyclic-nucleotide 2'-phosphodiesterase (5'-nucleotidase family)
MTLSMANYTQLEEEKGFPFTLFHTNDLHSHFEGRGPDYYFTPLQGDNDPVKGHYARLAFMIKKLTAEKRSQKEPYLLLDAGDFFSGTLFHTLGPRKDIIQAPEFEFFQTLKYDAVILGNHEFDAGEEGLKTMLNKASAFNPHFKVLVSNLDSKGKKSFLKDYMGQGEFQKKTPFMQEVFLKDLHYKGQTLRVGIIGLMGPDASFTSMNGRKEVSFIGHNDKKSKKRMKDLIKVTRRWTDYLKKEKKAQVVVVVMHGGAPEDEDLAKKVKGLDVIIAGHTHKTYESVVGPKGVILSQAGAFGRFVGRLELIYDDGKVRLRKKARPHLVAIDDSVPVDKDLYNKIEGYKKLISKMVVKDSAYKYKSQIMRVKKKIERGTTPKSKLGALVTKALRQELSRHLKDPIDIYFNPLTLIRWESIPTVKKDKEGTVIQYSDIFRMLGLGFDDDMNPGTPIVDFYISKKDFVKVLQFTELYRLINIHSTISYSPSLEYRTYKRIPFLKNKKKYLRLHGLPFEHWPERLHVATNLTLGKYIFRLKELSYGLVNVVITDKEGHKIRELKPLKDVREYTLFSNFLKKNKDKL